MKYHFVFALAGLTLGSCKTSDPVASVDTAKIHTEVLMYNCLPLDTHGSLQIKISNRGESTLKFNPGYFYLCDVFDEKNEPVPAHTTICPLLSTNKEWYEVKKDSTVLIPIQLTGLHKYPLRTDQNYMLELSYFQGDIQRRDQKQGASYLSIHSGRFTICK